VSATRTARQRSTVAAGLSAAGATPVRVILALAIWGAFTPSEAA
jgi:hypothetical protein